MPIDELRNKINNISLVFCQLVRTRCLLFCAHRCCANVWKFNGSNASKKSFSCPYSTKFNGSNVSKKSFYLTDRVVSNGQIFTRHLREFSLFQAIWARIFHFLSRFAREFSLTRRLRTEQNSWKMSRLWTKYRKFDRNKERLMRIIEHLIWSIEIRHAYTRPFLSQLHFKSRHMRINISTIFRHFSWF